MMRIVVAALTLSLILGITEGQSRHAEQITRLGHLELAGTESANWRQAQCRYRHLEDGWGWSYHEVALTIGCAVKHWSVFGGVDKAMSVASCESGLDETAYNPAGYGGVFQHAISAWPYRFANLAPPWWRLRSSVFNGRSNVVIAIRYASRYGWSAWSCA